MWAHMPAKPLLLVDVDGVISLFGFTPDTCPDGSWHQIDGVAHLLSAQAPALLLGLMSEFELVWCTGWEERADEHLPALLGLPRLPWLSFDRNPGRANAHWKLAAIDGHVGAQAVAWLDDALDARCDTWAHERRGRGAPTLLVRTDPAVGLTTAERDALRIWAAGLSSTPDAR